MDDFGLLIVARVVTSLAAGSITVIILTLSGKTSNPSRAFGIFVVFQLAMGALILAVFPSLFAGAGVAAIYWTLAGLAVLCLLVVNRIDGEVSPTASPVAASTSERIPIFKAAAGMAAVLLFYVALSGVWSFMAQISAGSGINLSASSLILSLATVAGILSALTATALGDTPRRRLYLIAGYLGIALSIGLLFGSPALVRFAIAAVIFKFAWTFILPYLLSTLSDLSNGGHLMNTHQPDDRRRLLHRPDRQRSTDPVRRWFLHRHADLRLDQGHGIRCTRHARTTTNTCERSPRL